MGGMMEAFTGEIISVSGDSERNSIVIALLMLLGARPQDQFDLGRYPNLEYTILGYGTPDLHQLHNNRQIDSYCEDLSLRIQNYDRRLAAVTVIPDKNNQTQKDTLHLVVKARLAGSDETIGLSTDIRLIDGSCEIRETGGD